VQITQLWPPRRTTSPPARRTADPYPGSDDGMDDCRRLWDHKGGLRLLEPGERLPAQRELGCGGVHRHRRAPGRSVGTARGDSEGTGASSAPSGCTEAPLQLGHSEEPSADRTDASIAYTTESR
jgi:hypothetical protein